MEDVPLDISVDTGAAGTISSCNSDPPAKKKKAKGKTTKKNSPKSKTGNCDHQLQGGQKERPLNDSDYEPKKKKKQHSHQPKEKKQDGRAPNDVEDKPKTTKKRRSSDKMGRKKASKNDSCSALNVETLEPPKDEVIRRKPSALYVHMDGSVTPPDSSRSLRGHQQVTNNDHLSVELDVEACNGNKTNTIFPETQTPRCCTSRRLLVFTLFLCVLLAGAGVGVWYFVFRDEDQEEGELPTLGDFHDRDVVSHIPSDICNEGIPGTGSSCGVDTTNSSNTGLLCDLLAQAMMEVTGSDIAIVNGGICHEDIQGPEVTIGDIMWAVTSRELAIIETSGRNLTNVLEQALDTSFSQASSPSAYPFAAGLRFDVKANRDFGDRIELCEIDVDHLGLWRPISPGKFYKIVTTWELAGGMLGYNEFAGVISAWKTPLSLTTGDALLNYMLDNPDSWSNLTSEKHSTHSFVGPNVEPAIANAPEPVCFEWMPGTGMSEICQPEALQEKGGGACNLVAWGLLDQHFDADIVLVKASLCANDISRGHFTESNAQDLLPRDSDLVTVRLTGYDIIFILNRAIDDSIDGGRADRYPYAASLRYSVDASAGPLSRVSSVEVMDRSNRWSPLSVTDSFTVLTTDELASGMDDAYQDFLGADPSSFRYLGIGARATFMNFAREWEVLYDPPITKYSTQSYIK